MSDLLVLGAAELAAAYRRRELSPVEVASATLDAAERLGPELRAFALVDREGALSAAQASEARFAATGSCSTLLFPFPPINDASPRPNLFFLAGVFMPRYPLE